MENKADEILSFLEISHLADRSFSDMSTGEARRFLIGRALVHNPRVLILDEPSNSLDLHALHMLRSTMRKVAAHTVIILVTHSLPDIIPEINRVILFKNGAIYQDGPKEEVLIDRFIRAVFDVPVRIIHDDGYYYATGY
jgi:iron complex transport system ATP-binding protein